MRRRGQAATEYVIIVGLIGGLLVSSARAFGGRLGGAFERTSQELTSAGSRASSPGTSGGWSGGASGGSGSGSGSLGGEDPEGPDPRRPWPSDSPIMRGRGAPRHR